MREEKKMLEKKQQRSEKNLIILRGVPASGKTQVSSILREKIGEDAVRLDLDKYAPEWETNSFEKMIDNALDYYYVIGELFSGRWHTTEPLRWISKFKSAGYTITSFVLNVSLDKGYENCCDPRHTSWRPNNIEDYKSRYIKFYDRQEKNIFASKAGLNEEIQIDAEDCNWIRIATKILNEI